MLRISPYGKPHTTWIILISAALAIGAGLLAWWWALAAVIFVALILIAFFRDPNRKVPAGRGLAVSPADGRISSVHTLDHFEPFDGPAVCIRVFLSVLDVHVNRSPLHGRVRSLTHKPGKYINALKAESAELNESMTIVFEHPVRGEPTFAVRQIAGAIARRIVCGAEIGNVYQRGERFGLIKFGSTTELYLPHPERVTVKVGKGLYVYGGATVLAEIAPQSTAEGRSLPENDSAPEPTSHDPTSDEPPADPPAAS